MAKVGPPTKFKTSMLEKVRRFYDSWEPYYENPVDRQDKEGNVTTKMEMIPNHIPTLGQLAEYLGVTRTTLWRWEDEHKELCNAIKNGVKRCLEEGIWSNAMLGKYNATMAIFAAKNKLGWTDRQENTHRFPEPVIFRNPEGEIYKKITFDDAGD